MRRLVVAGLAIAAGIVAVALLVGGGLVTGPGSSASATALPPVPASDRVVAEARVVPETSAEVGATVPGTVVRVAVVEGDGVAAGAELVKLDTSEADARVAQAQAALDASAARTEQAAVAVRQAAAEVDRAAASVRVARATRDLVPDGAASARKRSADAQVSAALAGLEAARAAEDAAAAAAKAAEADKAVAAAGLDGARAAAARLTIRAPIAGTVADLAVAVGDSVSAGLPLIRIAGEGGWAFETTDLAQDSVAVIEVGDTATVTVDGFPGTSIPGRVARIAAFGEDRQGDVVFTAVVVPDGAVPDSLRWNMKASIEIAATP